MESLSVKSIPLWDCSYNICDIELSLTGGKDYRDVNTSLVKRGYWVFNLIDICMNDGYITLTGSALREKSQID